MNAEQMKHTALKVLEKDSKYNCDENKDKMLVILRNSNVKLIETNIWYRGYNKPSGLCYENIELRVPVHLISNARVIQNDIEGLLRYVYEDSLSYTDGSFEIRPMRIDLDGDLVSVHNVHFEEIKESIIQAIRSAKYSIWVAVAWFTDEGIFEELLRKKQKGISVRIITSDEDSNKSLIAKLEKNFDTKKYPKVKFNRLHDKFCIIDLEYVLHGSYNWSFNAINNAETLATALDKDFVNKFADEFIKLYSSVN